MNLLSIFENKEQFNDDSDSPKKVNPLVRNIIIGSAILIVTIAVVLICSLIQPPNTNTHNAWNVKVISELASLECKYHNVAIYDIEGGFLGIGAKEIWIEYDGIVKVGVDANKLKISEPDAHGVVRVYLPDAEILSINVDETSFEKPVCQTDIFTNITIEDEAKIVTEQQQKMKEEAQFQEYILARAQQNAKKVIENYIVTLGEQFGVTYTVEWENVEEPVLPTLAQ